MSARFRPGDYLLVDDLTDEEIWRSDAAKDWDGSIRRADDLDGKHPDLFFKKFPMEARLDLINSPAAVSAVSNTLPTFVGLTTVLRPKSPADHLFD